jgi:ankyrin repeat protein
LHDAALKGQLKMVQLLLDHGGKVDSRNKTGGTPLHDAALGGHADVVELLLDRGARVDAIDDESQATPLMLAASMDRAEVISVLLKRGADAKKKDRAGQTALERARKSENQEVIQLLEEPSHGH